jgi:hypothetical protein
MLGSRAIAVSAAPSSYLSMWGTANSPRAVWNVPALMEMSGLLSIHDFRKHSQSPSPVAAGEIFTWTFVKRC